MISMSKYWHKVKESIHFKITIPFVFLIPHSSRHLTVDETFNPKKVQKKESKKQKP